MGGDHKCPLCSATFTRPQHVGRHLRAHTGDRPYECKECPLRFARSDLLSRHVNKVHKPPEEGETKAKTTTVKKGGRRKSVSSSASNVASSSQNTALATSSTTTEKARRASFDHAPTQPSPRAQLQAQRMYPHHPLLAGPPSGQAWYGEGAGMSIGATAISAPQFANLFVNTALPGMGGNILNGTIQPPFTAVPMRLSGSDQGVGSANARAMTTGPNLTNLEYDFGYKKRACDQCNHSKVRCDFAEPCQRCMTRNLDCSYNKPPKSRSVASMPSQRLSLPMSSINSNFNALSTSSTSPQSHFSSPHSTSSADFNPMLAPAPPGVSQPNLAEQAQPVPLIPSSHPQWSGTPANDHWQMSNPGSFQNFDPSQVTISQPSPQIEIYPVSGQQHPTSIKAPPRRYTTSSSDSPQRYLAPTPSLTSLSTSPSGSDGSYERRMSQSGQLIGVGARNDRKDSSDSTSLPHFDSSFSFAMSMSPQSIHPPLNLPPTSNIQPALGAFALTLPPSTGTIDPAMDFRGPMAFDEDDAGATTRPGSSGTSIFADLEENIIQAIQQRRRSSAGVWATAFDQMSLQDPNISNLPADPYSASQFVQQQHARRPNYPTVFHGHDGSSPTKIPSLGDAKDLWKLFMSEPSSGAGPAMDANPPDPSTQQNVPARPGMGKRGLSKSNSLPDLTSPHLVSQTFFSSYYNEDTPKPTDPGASYMSQPQMASGSQTTEDGTMRTWRNQINQRQASFSLDPGAGTKIGRSTSPSGQRQASNPMPNEQASMMLPPEFAHRPVASILQQSSALQQTLAPERTPSFGIDNLPTPTRSAFGTPTAPNTQPPQPQASKLSSSMARPGNKRLASQTLVPDLGKRSTGVGLWDDEGDEGGTLADDEGRGGGGVGCGGGGVVRGPTSAAELFAMPHGMFGGSVTPIPGQPPGYFSTWPAHAGMPTT